MSWASINVKTAPTVEPLTTVEAKAHLRVDISDDDTLIDFQITSARETAESDTKRSFLTQTLEMRFDRFPCGTKDVKLLRPPVQSVVSIKYIDVDGDEQTWDSSKYTVDIYSLPPRIFPAVVNNVRESYPSTQNVENAVTIEYKTGYGDASTNMPKALIQAIKMLLGHWYEHREDSIQSAISTDVPQSYGWIVDKFEVFNSD